MINLIRGRLGVARLLVVVVGAGCAVAPGAHGQEPKGGRINVDSMSDDEFKAHLRTLRFVTDSEAGDRQALLVGRYPDSARLGPLATILPELHAYEMSAVEFERGRVIARIQNESADSFPALGLLPHLTTYWWVEYNQTAQPGSSTFITVRADSTIVRRTHRGLLVTSHYESFRPNQALARFVWTPTGEVTWSSCSGRCCRPATLELPK